MTNMSTKRAAMRNSGIENTRRRVVVVTGASAGLGRSIVREFAKKDADVALIARGPRRGRA
jgi:short-subunit dehydrogenase